MIVGFIVELLVGALLIVMGLLLWIKKQVNILHTYHYKNVKEEDIPALVKSLCWGDGRQGSISGFVTLNEDDCANIYRLMV